jgi:macrolide transport system ATP-binding/permease protein
MKRLRASIVRLAGMFSRERHARAIADEIESHLEMHIDDNIRAGMTPEQARRAAVLTLGGVEATKQAWRDRSTVPALEHLLQDTRFAIRQLAKHPGFTLTAILMLTLGMGASLTIFGFVDAALIKPLPYPDPARLMFVTETTPEIPRANLSYPDYLDWKRLNTVFSSLDVFTGRGYAMSGSSGTQLVSGMRVSDGFFRTLGVRPVLGRDFHPGEDLPSAPRTVILSDAFWRIRFGASRAVIGQSVTLSDTAYTIIGVLPPDFQFAPAELWTTLHPAGSCDLRRSCHGLVGIGRLKDGISVDTALVEMKGIARQLEQQYPDSNKAQGAVVLPLSDVIVGDVRPILLMLLGGATLLLLIACVNVSSLLLVRAESRRRELAVRRALGASRARLIGQFVTEALVLVVLGGVLALTCAHGAMQLLTRLIPADMQENMSFLSGLGVNGHVVAYAGMMSSLAIALFSIIPASRVSASEMRQGMADGSRGSAGTTWHRLGFKLVILELATAMVLLVGAGLLAKSFSRLIQVDLGFQPARLATMRVVPPMASYATNEQKVALARRVISRIAALPGVTSVGLSNVLPVLMNGNTTWIRFVGRPYNGEHNEVNSRDVSADYFKTLQARLLRGRFFTDQDDTSKPRVVIINQTLARLYFPGEDPIGKMIGDTGLSPASLTEIIGVVDDIREGPLDAEIWPAVYYPFNQGPDSAFALVVRTSQPEQSVLATLGAAVREIDPTIATIGETTMTARIQDSPIAYLRRSSARLAGSFAAVALLLGIVGLYGVIAYSVSQRTREIGVRMALGAQPRAVYQLILREAGQLVALGLAVGLACSLTAATLMRKLLFSTPPWDVPTLATVAVLLGGAALLAGYIPARRAASVNPIEVMRPD